MLTIQETPYSLQLIPAVRMLLRVFPDIWVHGVSGDSEHTGIWSYKSMERAH